MPCALHDGALPPCTGEMEDLDEAFQAIRDRKLDYPVPSFDRLRDMMPSWDQIRDTYVR